VDGERAGAPSDRRRRDVRASVLTPTQRRVLELIAAGEKTPDLCRVLFVTRNTVAFHRRCILRELRARSMPHAVALAIRVGRDRGERRGVRPLCATCSEVRDCRGTAPLSPAALRRRRRSS
jgi:DNA-binding CsgD family transcriptional regulator